MGRFTPSAEHSCRIAGKVLEEKIFNNRADFPTTLFLLDNDNNLTPERKKMIYSKINTECSVDLSNKNSDSPQNRRLIHECVGHIRSKFYKKNEMLLQRNIQLGFAKNLAGGSLIAIVASIAGLAGSQADPSLLLDTETLLVWVERLTSKHLG